MKTFFAYFVKKEIWAYDICVPFATLEPVDRFLQNLVRTLYALRGIPKAMVFIFVQLVRATWQVHKPGGGGCQHFVWGLEAVYCDGA